MYVNSAPEINHQKFIQFKCCLHCQPSMSGTNALNVGLPVQANGDASEDLHDRMTLTVLGCGKLPGLRILELQAD